MPHAQVPRTRIALLSVLVVAAFALGLLAGGVAAWLPLASIVVARIAWVAGDRQIRELVNEPHDAGRRARDTG